jgi:hypothetical protein
MKTNVRETSLKALEENGIVLGKDQQVVYEVFLKFGPMSDNQMLEYLRGVENQRPAWQRHRWEKSDITGRRNQLMGKNQIDNEGLIIDRGVFFGWVEIRGVKRIKSHHFWAPRYDMRPVPHGWYSNIKDVPGRRPPRLVLAAKTAGGASEKLKVNSEKRQTATTLF